jgi:hypothetical protein
MISSRNCTLFASTARPLLSLRHARDLLPSCIPAILYVTFSFGLFVSSFWRLDARALFPLFQHVVVSAQY